MRFINKLTFVFMSLKNFDSSSSIFTIASVFIIFFVLFFNVSSSVYFVNFSFINFKFVSLSFDNNSFNFYSNSFFKSLLSEFDLLFS